MRSAGISFEFFEGITGDQAISQGKFHTLRRKQFLLNTGREPTAGEIGCFASHKALWAKCVAIRRPIMVMEDDFKLSDDFPDMVARASRLIDRVGFLRLQKSSNARYRKVAVFENTQLLAYTKPPHCTMCYCISPTVAGHFLSLTNEMDAPVDIFIKRYWRHGQPLYALTPYSVSESSVGTNSTIPGRAKNKKPMKTAAHRFTRKCKDNINRLVFNLRHRFAFSKSSIPTNGDVDTPSLSGSDFDLGRG